MTSRSALLPALAGCAALALPAQAVVIDFNTDSGGMPIPAGTVVQDQFASLGIASVTADNVVPQHPDKAIIFDSGDPTGGDFDLATPGYHASNTTPYGNLLIIAENDRDSNHDGLVDNPDDEGHKPAGFIHFVLSMTSQQARLVLVDIEELGGSVQFFMQGSPVGSVPIPRVGDNAVAHLSFSGDGFDALRVSLAGSGGIAEMELLSEQVPEPTTLLSLVLAGAGCLAGPRPGRRRSASRRRPPI